MAYAVLTRDEDAIAAYAEVLAPLGLEAVAMPVTRTEPPRDPAALARAVARGGYTAIACQSARAATALVEAAAGAELPEVWAVGPATARALEAARIAVHVPDAARDGASLAHAMITSRELAGARVLVPRAEQGRDEAIAILRAAGAIVDDVIAYRTVAVPADDPSLARGRALLAAGAICVVFAPSQVAALAAIVDRGALVALRCAAIGDTTAAALHELGVTTVAVADRPSPEGIANAVAAVYQRA